MAQGRVFICHSHVDNAVVDRYVEALQSAGYDLWYDRGDLQVGGTLESRLQRALQDSSTLLVFLSPAAVNSYWVRLEMSAFQALMAQDRERRLIPVVIAPTDLPMLLRAYLRVDAVDQPFDAVVHQLVEALGAPAKSRVPAVPIQEQNAWGDPISTARQNELRTLLQKWRDGESGTSREGPFDGVRLTGADVYWLFKLQDDRNQDLIELKLPLQGADLTEAQLQRASLDSAQLQGAKLRLALLDGATLRRARLDGADLSAAQAKHVNLSAAHLEGTDLSATQLEGANLRWAWFDNRTFLSGVSLDSETQLGDIQWGGVGNVNLTNIKWDGIHRLGDEREVGRRGKMEEHEAIVRACRQISAQLRAQGMTEAADRFAFRAQVRQRGVLLRQGHIPQYIGSWLLYAIAGYGYRPGRTLAWYIATIVGFMWGYLAVTHGALLFGITTPTAVTPLEWYEALVLSISSFHGRGFFQPLQNPGDPVAVLAAAEAVIGLFIEISFIATFTQRYFGAR